MDGLNSRVEGTEKRIGELKDKKTEITPSNFLIPSNRENGI